MARKIFVDNESVVYAADLNRLEDLRCLVFDEATTKTAAREAIGAVSQNHAHSVAVPSVNKIGGNDGFIAATDAEALRKVTSFPTTFLSSVPDSHAIAVLTPTGDVLGVTIGTLKTIFGSGGGGGPSPTTGISGGEVGDPAEPPVGSFDGGEVGNPLAPPSGSFDGGEII